MRSVITVLFIFGVLVLPGRADEPQAVDNQLLTKITNREQAVAEDLRGFHPLTETYIQVLARRKGKLVLWHDRYFLSQADFSGQLKAVRFKPHDLGIGRNVDEYSDSLAPNSVQFDPGGFVAMAYPDPSNFDLAHYQFQYIKREFLGEVRCLVFDVEPTTMRKSGLFKGRIWVEDQDLTIVRFNGIYEGSNFVGMYYHFDSWRTNVGNNQWVPSVIYSEELNRPCCGFWKFNWTKLRFKSQTRFWGYNAHLPGSEQALAKIVVDPSPIQDLADANVARTPIEQMHAWQREAENNAADKLESIGLLGPTGEVERVLFTVANNIEVTNNLSFEPDLKFRVLLTSKLESAVVGHTIFVSRGLLDVLPDESTLAMVLARNIALVKLGYTANTEFGFADRARFKTRDAFRKMYFQNSDEQQREAGQLAEQWIGNSPYKNGLGSVSQFVAQLQHDSFHVYFLLEPSLGNSVSDTFGVYRSLKPSPKSPVTSELPALALGSRIVLDPWTDRLTFLPNTPSAALLGENRAFAVTPFVPHLRRARPSDASAANASADDDSRPAMRSVPY
jgi:hypothetical protein